MKKYILFGLIFFIKNYFYAQISSGNIDPNPYAELDIVSPNKGALIPRVILQSTTSSLPISSNAGEMPTSLLVFNESSSADLSEGYYYWYNNKWNKIISSGESGILGTVIYDSINKAFTYTNLSRTPLDLPIDKIIQDHETTTIMTFDETSKKLSYVNEKGNNPIIDLSMIGQPTGVAGGDLSGNYPNPTVVKLQTKPVLATAPITNQVLRFNGTSWGPQTLAVTEPWYVVGGTTQATSNTQNIYQMGNVSIGKNTTGAKLDVVSDALINDLTIGKGGGVMWLVILLQDIKLC